MEKYSFINIELGVLAILGDRTECNKHLKNLKHTIDLYIQYGNQPIQPIQIQIDDTRWEERSEEMYYVNLLREQEIGAAIYNSDKHLIPTWE